MCEACPETFGFHTVKPHFGCVRPRRPVVPFGTYIILINKEGRALRTHTYLGLPLGLYLPLYRGPGPKRGRVKEETPRQRRGTPKNP